MKTPAAHPSEIPVFILAGGLGTRLAEETSMRPKPMVEIGGLPILVHIMRYYHSFGFDDFVICAGHLSHMIKDYFTRYELLLNHIELDHRKNPDQRVRVFGHSAEQERWRVRVIETGTEAMTAARVARALDVIAETEGGYPATFALTYGDGLADVDLQEELEFHRKHKKIGTVLGVKPVARFGELGTGLNGEVFGFVEKPRSKHSYMNGGFFFFQREFREYLSTDAACVLEQDPLEKLAKDNQLQMFANKNFWQCMDNLRDKMHLQELWDSKDCPWRRG